MQQTFTVITLTCFLTAFFSSVFANEPTPFDEVVNGVSNDHGGDWITSSHNHVNDLDLMIKQFQQKAKNQHLSTHKVWQRLFYANKQQISDVKYTNFFLSKDGKNNLQAELDITLEKMFTDNTEDSPQCRFPARTAWLTKTLQIDKNQLAKVNCTAFNDWYQKINPNSMTLIFATDYMGSPGSMFGHTLLRIDPVKTEGKNLDLFAYALNYAATTPNNENGMVYAYKGLTGKYPGSYSLMRYFHKTKEYGDLESRDMWEYELDLTPDEVAFLVGHIWEMQNVNFPYYFMDKNCSYAILGLMDLVRPELNLQSKFGLTAVPIETVKAVKKAGLIKQTKYRPALETQIQTQEKTYGKPFAKMAHKMTLPEVNPQQVLQGQSIENQAKLLELAYDDLYFQHGSKKVKADFSQNRLRELLLLRSQIIVDKQKPEPIRPKYDPTQGHGDKLWGVWLGEIQNKKGVFLHHRVAYHHFSDPQMGYGMGQLTFLDGAIGIYDNKLKFDYLDVLSVHAINPMTSYKKPYSWGWDFGFQQVAMDKGQFSTKNTHIAAITAGQIGYAKNFGEQLVCGAYVRAEMQAAKAIEKGGRAGIVPKIHCLAHFSDHWQASMDVSTPFWQTGDKQTVANAQVTYSLSSENALHLSAHHESQNGQDWQKMMFGFSHYY